MKVYDVLVSFSTSFVVYQIDRNEHIILVIDLEFVVNQDNLFLS